MWTSRAGLTGCLLEWILPSSQARAARVRVLKNRAAQSHLSIRTPGMIYLNSTGARTPFRPASFLTCRNSPTSKPTSVRWSRGSWCSRSVYALTRICSLEYIKRVESVFEIIAEPNRRAILSLLVSSQQSVGEIERQLRMPQPAVSKHLRVLREAGFVESKVDAQRRLYRLKPEPLQEVDAWLAQFRRFWSAHVDALERHLDRMDQLTQTKRKTRKKR